MRKQSFEVRILNQNQPIWTQVEASVRESNPDERFLTLSDICLRKRAEERLQEAQVELFTNERLTTLGQLAGGVAHEMRNPLSVMKNAAGFLQETLKEVDQETIDALDEISRSLHISERIVEELLNYASGRQPEPSKFLVSDAIDAALNMIKMPDSVSIDRAYRPSIQVSADRGQIERLLVNLIQNAIQAMPKGGILTLRCGVSRGGRAITEVADTGVGIAADELEKIFDPLFTTRPKGIGLGLALCRRYAEIDAGTLQVESVQGKGSIFTFTLPSD